MSCAIEELTYTNERGESLAFSVASPFYVNFKNVSGLSDIRNIVYSINSMGQDGDTLVGNRIESRDIEVVGHIKAIEKERKHFLQRQISRILNPHYDAKLVYKRGDYTRVIDCKVENAPVFSRNEVFVHFTIQLVCLNPFWREETETREDIALWVGAFEFPLEIPVTGIEMGYRQPSLIVNVPNNGDVRAGMRIEFRALGAVENPSLLNINTGEFIRFNMTLIAGDALTVSTAYGQKRATLTRGGVDADAFKHIDVDSDYLQLEVGDNLFRYDADTNLGNLEVSIYHNNYYLGV